VEFKKINLLEKEIKEYFKIRSSQATQQLREKIDK
jgi:hypothetical protein